MSYCITSDVARYLTKLKISDFTNTTNPTSDQVQSFIDEIGNEIDSVLITSGIKLPIVANDYLQKLNALGASALVIGGLELGGENEKDTARDWRVSQYEKRLEMLKANPRLSGVTILAANGQECAQTNISRGDNFQHILRHRMW